MKSDHYEPADLNSIIKTRQSYTPKSSGERQGEKVQLAHQGSEQDYHSLKSQYTTNYVSVPHPPVVKNAKAVRQEVNLIRNQEHPGEFWAYCIVMKESNLGIYNNQRLILLDSRAKTLSYYSQIPPLPLTTTAGLPVPKETIQLATVKKFNYAPDKNGIGEVVVGWSEGEGAKQWRITMSSRRVAKDFGMIVEQVRTNQYLNKRNNDSVKKIEPVSDKKVNKKETQFISQINKLEEQNRRKNSSSSSIAKPATIMMNDRSVRKLSNKSIAPPTPKAEEPIPVPPKQQDPLETHRQQKDQPIFMPLQQEVTSQQSPPDKQPQKSLVEPATPQQAVLPEIKMEEIIKRANMQLADISAIRSPQSETKRFNELQNILSSRKPKKEKYYRSSLNSHNGNRLSEKKPVVQKIDQATADTFKTDAIKKDQRSASPQVLTQKQQSRYEDKYNSFRMSLLQQRRLTKDQKGMPRGHPKRESARMSGSTRDEGRESWLCRWVEAAGKEQLGAVYSKFVDQCETSVRKLASNYENWHLLHKAGLTFQFEEAGIDFFYFIFRQQSTVSTLIEKELEFTNKINNWSYLLSFVYQQQKVRFRVPLACMVSFKGLKVLCKASLAGIIHSPIEDICQYVRPLREVEDQCKISLHRCQLIEIIIKDVKFIYFNELDALPKLINGEIVGWNYISVFIKEGVIRNQLDLEEIDRHISEKLVHKLVERLNLTHLLSTIQLEELLSTYGINPTFMGRLYARTKQYNLVQANKYLSSELAAMGLAECVRVGMHRHVMLQRKDGATQTVFSLFKLFLEGNLLLLQQMILRLRVILKTKVQLDYKSLITPYVVSSALSKLGGRCDFLRRLPIEQLEDLGIDIWSRFTFSPDFVNIYFVSSVNTYHYRNFLQSQLLEQQIFKNKAQLSEDLTKEKILLQINPEAKEHYPYCQRYRLLPPILKCRLNFYLAHYSPPENHNLGLPFDKEHSELYFTLYQHSSACMMTHENFAEDLIGIKWLIKRRKFEEAEYKLGEQRLRAWIWGRHNPQVLMEVHDLESLYALKRGCYQTAAQYSLTTLQIAIHFYGQDDRYWQLIWQKAFFVADVHFQSGKFDQIQALYDICETLSLHIKTDEVPHQAINEQFLEVYRKRAIVQLTEGRTDECIQSLQASLGKLGAWKSYFGEKRAASLLVKLDSEVFDIYRLLLRNYEIKSQYTNYGLILQEVLVTYFEKDWSPLYLNNPKLKLTDTAKQRLSELIKGVWLYINKSIEDINRQVMQGGQQPIKQELIYHYLEAIRFENRYFYRYTTQELFKYLVQLVVSRPKSPESSKKSNILAMVVECLSMLSTSDQSHKRCRLYEEGSKENKLLLLESISHLAGYEFCMGVLQQCFHNYSCQF